MKFTTAKSQAIGVVLAMGCIAGAGAQVISLPQAHYRITPLPVVAAAAAQDKDANTKDDLFAGTEMFSKNATSSTEINMGSDSLDMVSGADAHHAHNMVLNVVRKYVYDKPGMYNMDDVEVFRKKLSTGDWNCSVHTRDSKTGSSTDICNRPRADGLKESAIISVEPKSLTFIHTIRRPDSGHSELGNFPGLPSIETLPAFAMLDAEGLAEMQVAMAKLSTLDLPAMQMRLQGMSQRLKTRQLPEMQQKLDKMRQQLKPLELPHNAPPLSE